MANVGYTNILNAINESAAKNTAASQAMAEKQMAFNSAEAKASRDWQEMMSNTAHQREVKDLLAAGLNPILSVNGGAPVTSGAQAQGSSGKVDEGLTNALTTYLASLISSATQINTAGIAAAASKYSADKSASASAYSAELTGKYSSLNRVIHGALDGLLSFGDYKKSVKNFNHYGNNSAK